jgi:hypothetical protein
MKGWYVLKENRKDLVMLDDLMICGPTSLLEEAAKKTRLLLQSVISEWVIWTYHRIPPQDELPVGIEASDDEEEAADAPEGTDKGNAMEGNGKGGARDAP